MVTLLNLLFQMEPPMMSKLPLILVEQLDLTDTEMVCMDKGYDSEIFKRAD